VAVNQDPFSQDISGQVIDLPPICVLWCFAIVIMEKRDVKPDFGFVYFYEADFEHVRFLEIKVGGDWSFLFNILCAWDGCGISFYQDWCLCPARARGK
jgi:hypothetical protein